jgi:hypothetical protein
MLLGIGTHENVGGGFGKIPLLCYQMRDQRVILINKPKPIEREEESAWEFGIVIDLPSPLIPRHGGFTGHHHANMVPRSSSRQRVRPSPAIGSVVKFSFRSWAAGIYLVQFSDPHGARFIWRVAKVTGQ